MLTPDYSVYLMCKQFGGVRDLPSRTVQDVAQIKCKLGWRASIGGNASRPTRHPLVQPYRTIPPLNDFLNFGAHHTHLLVGCVAPAHRAAASHRALILCGSKMLRQMQSNTSVETVPSFVSSSSLSSSTSVNIHTPSHGG